MADFGSLLARLARGLEEAGLPAMVIGGQAVLLHGEPRLTQDIDVTLGVGPGEFRRVADLCESVRLTPLPEDPEAFVRSTFVLPAEDERSGIRVDLIFSTTPYEAEAIDRAIGVEIEGVAVPFASAEDLILHKLFAGRPRDLDDALGVVRRKGEELDWGYLERWVGEFGRMEGYEGMPATLERLREPSE